MAKPTNPSFLAHEIVTFLSFGWQRLPGKDERQRAGDRVCSVARRTPPPSLPRQIQNAEEGGGLRRGS